MELAALVLLLGTGSAVPCAPAGPAGGWAVPAYVTWTGTTLAFWGPMGYGDEVHESESVVSWRVGSESAELLDRREVPCLVPGVVSRPIALPTLCDELGGLGEIEGGYWLYPGRDDTTYLQTESGDWSRTALLRLDGKTWRPLEQADRLTAAPLLSIPSGAPSLAQPAGLLSGEHAFARDEGGRLLLGSREGDVFLARADGTRRKVGLSIPDERHARWKRITLDARPWDFRIVLTRRLASGSIEIAVVSLSSGDVTLHETLQPPPSAWKWTTVLRAGDGSLVALSEIRTSIRVPVSFRFRAIGGPDAVVREVCVARAGEDPGRDRPPR